MEIYAQPGMMKLCSLGFMHKNSHSLHFDKILHLTTYWVQESCRKPSL